MTAPNVAQESNQEVKRRSTAWNFIDLYIITLHPPDLALNIGDSIAPPTTLAIILGRKVKANVPAR